MSRLSREYFQPNWWPGKADWCEEDAPEPPLTNQEIQAIEDRAKERALQLVELQKQLKAGLIDRQTYRRKFYELHPPVYGDVEEILAAYQRADEEQEKAQR